MPVNLNTIPGPSLRPAPPKPLRWLGALAGFIASGILLMRFLGKLVGETSFWWFAIGVPVLFWLVLMGLRMTVYMMQQIHANAWDKRREQVILQEVRRGRRALQILAAEHRTAHAAESQSTDTTDALLRNENILFSQTSWEAQSSVRHSRLPDSEGELPQTQISNAFTALLKTLAEPLSHLPEDNPVAVLLESSSSLPDTKVRDLWRQAWLENELALPMEFIPGQGLIAIDHWLDYRIKDKAVLLVIALQIAPAQPENTAEAIAGLLLGNRLTQNTLPPIALLHRPELSQPEPVALQEKIEQAIDWVPLRSTALQHLWLAGISGTSKGHECAIVALQNPPLAAVDAATGVHDFNQFMGDPGLAAPWLAFAAAAQAISRSPAPHMIISGEPDSNAVWSTVVSPLASHKENTA
ncbi:hypothetical protein KWG64_19660 [Rahnella sp. PD12R]|uniref:hypothetical protein n=1 Tax=Rahnella sp. PD12R TaxID=2855688 RepID=UPI001C44A23C|nr:hypothetical protein [Rahnella sp. PD12R]MBV6820169.1 hypothetical protein [Rahnella sp. PD12R]